MPRPFKVRFFPLFPYTALIIAAISFVAMAIYNAKLTAIYCVLVALCYAIFKLVHRRDAGDADASGGEQAPQTKMKSVEP